MARENTTMCFPGLFLFLSLKGQSHSIGGDVSVPCQVLCYGSGDSRAHVQHIPLTVEFQRGQIIDELSVLFDNVMFIEAVMPNVLRADRTILIRFINVYIPEVRQRIYFNMTFLFRVATPITHRIKIGRKTDYFVKITDQLSFFWRNIFMYGMLVLQWRSSFLYTCYRQQIKRGSLSAMILR